MTRRRSGGGAHWLSYPYRYREVGELTWTYSPTLRDLKEDAKGLGKVEYQKVTRRSGEAIIEYTKII